MSLGSPSPVPHSIPFNLGTAKVDHTTAKATYSEEGKLIESGHRVTRLKLNNDDRLNIAIKDKIWVDNSRGNLFKQIYLKLQFIRLETTNGPIYININSLASRLHFSKKEIIEAANEGKLGALMSQQAELQTRVLDEYEGIDKAYGGLKKMTDETHIQKETLMKVIKTSVSILYDPTNLKDSTVITAESNTLLKEKHTFVAKRLDGHMEFFVQTEKKLGQGSFGIVSESYRLHSKRSSSSSIMAHKEAVHDTDQKRAENDLEAEYKMLKFLHSKNPDKSKPLEGIQAEPKAFVKEVPTDVKVPPPRSLELFRKKLSGMFRKKTAPSPSKAKVAYVGEKYDGTLDSNLPIEVKLKQGLEILRGLAFLAECSVVHKDLKAENILVKKNDDNTVTAHISDLGGARVLDPISGSFKVGNAGKEFAFGIHTPKFTSLPHALAAKAAWDRGDITSSNQLLLQNDVFSYGIVLFEHLTGKTLPCQRDQGYVHTVSPNSIRFQNALDKNNVPIEIQDLLKAILFSKPGNIMSAQEALTKYELAMKNS